MFSDDGHVIPPLHIVTIVTMPWLLYSYYVTMVTMVTLVPPLPRYSPIGAAHIDSSVTSGGAIAGCVEDVALVRHTQMKDLNN